MPGECMPSQIPDVALALANLPQTGVPISAKPGRVFRTWSYTATRENGGGFQNHFQGCQRLAGGPYLVVSGGDWESKCSHVFIVELGSKPATGVWGSNVQGGEPTKDDRAMVCHAMGDNKLWHAGGLDVQGHYLAVPIECTKTKGGFFGWLRGLFSGVKLPKCESSQSRVLFYDVSAPLDPRRLSSDIVRRDRKATAVALTQLSSGRYLVGVLSSGEDRGKKRRRIDFYVSAGAPETGFSPTPVTWWDDLDDSKRILDDYQCINFVTDSAGSLFMVGLHNRSSAAPTIREEDAIDLFRISIPGADRVGPELQIQTPVITPVPTASRTFTGPPDFENFDAGAGIYVEDDRLHLYAAYHFRSNQGLLRFAEFAS